MKDDLRGMVMMIAVAMIAVIVIISGLFVYSGMNRPLTVVESYSMQHSDDTSYLGIIDTGDMAVMISPDKKSVTTYVEGHENGYSRFGSYGDVIIYYRTTGNPVIHRAIIWLDYEDGRWSAPSLEDYPEDLWENEGGTWDNLTGTLTLKALPYKDSTMDISIDLDRLALDEDCRSGYLTKGDRNEYFDQNSSIHAMPVEKSELKAIAGLEIPWLGCIKLLIKDKNTWMIPDNSKTCLWILFMDIIVFIVMVSLIFEYRINMRKNAPTPPFPLEDEKGTEVTSDGSESMPCSSPEEQREDPS